MRDAPVWRACVVLLGLGAVVHGAIATFEDLALPPESYWNGDDGAGGFASGGVFFKNNYNTEWDSWDGFAYSNRTDIATTGIEGQYTAVAGSGQRKSATYGIVYVGWEEPPVATLSTPQVLRGLSVTNNNYTYYSMLHGSDFSKKFGGPTGDEPDWLKLSITGKDVAGDVTGTVELFLADLRFEDDSEDYIVDTWQFVDLTPLGEVKTLQFALDSSDSGPLGINTPAYFSIDTIIPEPATVLLLGLGGLLARRRRR